MLNPIISKKKFFKKTLDNLRIVFFGTPPFAADLLTHLIDSQMEIVGVISRPDKPQGRSRHFVPGAVKIVAESHRIPHFQPEKVSTIIPTLESFQADFFVVVAYGEILTQKVLDIPKVACINVHASLLPKYRGAAPIQRAIIEGQEETGITIMHMVRKMDAGDIIAQSAIPIENGTTYGTLELEMRKVSSILLVKALDQLKQGTALRLPQDETKVTYAPKIELEDCQIFWDKSATEIHNLVRGTNPEPGAWCPIWIDGEEKRLKIYTTSVRKEISVPPKEYTLESKNKLLIGCGVGTLEIIEVQLEGKKRMSAIDFYRGYSHGRWKLYS